jgi:hypothetical protein
MSFRAKLTWRFKSSKSREPSPTTAAVNRVHDQLRGPTNSSASPTAIRALSLSPPSSNQNVAPTSPTQQANVSPTFLPSHAAQVPSPRRSLWDDAWDELCDELCDELSKKEPKLLAEYHNIGASRQILIRLPHVKDSSH